MLCGRWQQGLAPLSPHHLPFLSLPVLSVGAQQPESFIGYFTTACVTIVLAIVSYVVLPHMVRLFSWWGRAWGHGTFAHPSTRTVAH